MAAVAAQYINLGPVLIAGLVLYIVVPFVACVFAGAIGVPGRNGAGRGALCGVLNAVVSMMGCGVVTEYSDNGVSAFVIQALVTAGVGAVVTYWVVGRKFWDN